MAEKTTNADMVRAMDDKELAQFLCNISDCLACPVGTECYNNLNGYMEWLQKEKKDG